VTSGKDIQRSTFVYQNATNKHHCAAFGLQYILTASKIFCDGDAQRIKAAK
jgi:hypothetical protein